MFALEEKQVRISLHIHVTSAAAHKQQQCVAAAGSRPSME